MISRFVFCTILFSILIGIAMHWNLDMPFIKEWVGKLPGDMVVNKGDARVDFPLASGALASFLYCAIQNLIFSKK